MRQDGGLRHVLQRRLSPRDQPLSTHLCRPHECVKKEDYGTFFSGDIVLNTYKERDESGKETNELAWDLHFWLGNTSTQDDK
jgi:hypothetical protein